ncbi:MAG: DUF4097 family beta strand repeat-containing protein [Bryobacteraceae bacterium]
MRGSRASAVLATAGALMLCASGGEWRREGRYWVARQAGTTRARGVRTVRITAGGAVSIRGGMTDAISWTTIARLRAGDELQAQAQALAPGVEQHREAQGLLLSFSSRMGQPVADVAIVVPRDLRLCQVRARGGPVQASDLGGALDVSSDAGSLQMDRIRGPVTARTGGGEIRVGRVEGDVRCFTGAGVIRVDWIGGLARLDTAGGEIFVQHVHGPLFASSAGGNIEIVRADSAITARTSGGVIEVGQAVGPVTADTAGGAIQIAGSSGAQCQASEGAIRLKNVAGGVRAISGSGDIVAQLTAGKRLESSTLSTNSGDITVVIPPSSAITVVAQSKRNGAAGRVISDFPEIRLAGGGGPGGSPEMAEGSLNGGGPVLQVVASGGVVYLRRQQP